MADEHITQLEEWYVTQCDGDWEHEFGIKIGTIDNPGWSVSIDLGETDLAGPDLELIRYDRGDRDWIDCRVREQRFEGYGGPTKLIEILRNFHDFRLQRAGR